LGLLAVLNVHLAGTLSLLVKCSALIAPWASLLPQLVLLNAMIALWAPIPAWLVFFPAPLAKRAVSLL
jgi:hypothetical protein